MLAVIRTGGKQYKVAPGDTITIERLNHDGKKVVFEDVLLIDGDKTVVGKPVVAGAAVTAELVGDLRGEKIRVFKYQAKSHWAKTIGHRQELTQVKIKDIATGEKTAPKVKVNESPKLEGGQRKP